jgi:hypothetical protein
MADDKQVSKEEQIGIHKGSLSTLLKEREELARLLNIVEQLVQMHMNALKELGVDVQAQQPQVQQEKKKPIEDVL